MALVAGRMRVPSPATGKTALRTRCFIRLLIGVAGISGYEPADDLITHKPIKRFPDSATRSSRGKSYGWLILNLCPLRSANPKALMLVSPSPERHDDWYLTNGLA